MPELEQTIVELNAKAYLGHIGESLAEIMKLENRAIDVNATSKNKKGVPFPLNEEGLPDLSPRTQMRKDIKRGIINTGSDYVNPPDSYCNVALDDSVEILSAGAESLGDIYREVLILGIDPIQVLVRKDVLFAAPRVQEIPNNYVFVRYDPGASVSPDKRMKIVEPLRELWQSMEMEDEFRLIGSDCKGLKLLVPYRKWNQISRMEYNMGPLKDCLLSYMGVTPNRNR